MSSSRPVRQPANSNARIEAGLARQPANERERQLSWYMVSCFGAIALTQNFIRDVIWPIMTYLLRDAELSRSTNFWADSAGQQLWSSIGVCAAAPLTALFWSWFYKERYLKCLRDAGISSAGTLAAIIPWNAFGALGQDFFRKQGFDLYTATYLASLFPGTGTAEGPVQNVVITTLSALFDPAFEFNGAVFALGFLPPAYAPGDTWLAVYNAMTNPAKKSPVGVIALGFAVAIAVMTMNYLFMILSTAVGKAYKTCRGTNVNVHEPRESITANIRRAGGSPVHQAIPLERLDPVESPVPANNPV